MKPRTFLKQLIPKYSKYKLNAEGIVLHDTATPGATAQNEFEFFSRYTGANAHAFIDWIQDLQIIPWDHQAWHAKDPANQKFIGVEMCVPKGHDPEKANIVYWATVDAFARIYRYILGIRTVTKDNCMSHHEVTLKWRRSTHTDPTAFFKEYGRSMDQFRADVQYRLDMKWRA